MRSIKTIVFGGWFIIIIGLILQLAYVFLAVGYNDMSKNYSFLNTIGIYLRLSVMTQS